MRINSFLALALLTLGSPAFAESPPTEFVTQVLEPTGGKILRPKSWFYSEGHRGSSYMWTLSQEDVSGNRPYTTGVRIQTFIGVKDATGKTAKEFILDFVAAKNNNAKVLNSCIEQDQGLFYPYLSRNRRRSTSHSLFAFLGQQRHGHRRCLDRRHDEGAMGNIRSSFSKNGGV